MNPDRIIATALAQGYCGFSFEEVEAASLQRSLRSVGKLTETRLTVKASAVSRRNTYSAAFGIGPFPFHTDFAFRAEPPRLIALCNPTEEQFERCTYVSDFASLPPGLRLSITKSAWKLKSNGKSYLLGGCSVRQSQTVFRWDLRALHPANREAASCATAVPQKLTENQHAFQWAPRSGILINNWRAAHARAGEASDEREGRTLVRYEVW